MTKLALTIVNPNGTPVQIQAPGGIPTGGAMTFNSILQAFVSLLFILGILIALFYLVWSGINWITSGGDKQKLQNARRKIMFSLLGLIVVLLAFAIINFIGTFFNVPLLHAGLPTPAAP